MPDSGLRLWAAGCGLLRRRAAWAREPQPLVISALGTQKQLTLPPPVVQLEVQLLSTSSPPPKKLALDLLSLGLLV